MKKYIIDDKTVNEVMSEMKGKLMTDHFIGGSDGAVEVIVEDAETYLDGAEFDYTSEPYIEEGEE